MASKRGQAESSLYRTGIPSERKQRDKCGLAAASSGARSGDEAGRLRGRIGGSPERFGQSRNCWVDELGLPALVEREKA